MLPDIPKEVGRINHSCLRRAMSMATGERLLIILALLIAILTPRSQAQVRSQDKLPDFIQNTDDTGLTISREVVDSKPFSVVGPHGALLGGQNGIYEAWIFPWKIFSGMRMTVNMDDYPVPIDVNKHAASIDVHPDHTTITYSHANFTIQQIMLAPKQAPDGRGVMVFYRIKAVRPMTLTLSFEPVMQRMWPAESDDHPSPEWVHAESGSGFYILHNAFPDHSVALSIPGAESGILPPYQERAEAWPLQFVLHFDPKHDAGTLWPLLVTLANQPESKANVSERLTKLNDSAKAIWEANRKYFQTFISQRTSLETPDQTLNDAFSWAEVAMDQLRVQTANSTRQALTAGFVSSGDAARPGFGWFFGRDGLWSLYALSSYGDFETSREEIEFLLSHQRADGKIMHEWSQTADLVDWSALPYEYASSDATPLLQMAVDDYLKISGDTDFVRKNWDALALSWQFETSHDSPDGIYNNQEGSGWVESWIPSMPHEEIYLAALDQQASAAFADLAERTAHTDLAQQAKQRATNIATKIEEEYFLPASELYAFSRNADGTTDDTPTIFPSVSWWDGTFQLNRPGKMLSRWASSEFSTDWGTRILSDQVSFYDPISYHQGTVWPLFTGWVSIAEYRTGRTLSGYAHLMQNANLTWSQDLGSVTELLSGQFYQALGRSTAHQLWSSAMVISPILRGMFGIEWNAATQTLSITPHIPADWNTATIRHLPLRDGTLDLSFARQGRDLIVRASGGAASGARLHSRTPGSKIDGSELHIPLPAVEVAVKEELPHFGEETQQMKILDQQSMSDRLQLTIAAQAGSRQTLILRENVVGLAVKTQDAEMGPMKDGLRTVTVPFPPGRGYVTKTVEFAW